MTLHRVTLRLTSPLSSPLVGPTLFGRICWMIAEHEGDVALTEWLRDCERCWTISDGFPHDMLPRPLVHPRPLEADQIATAKDRRKHPLVTRRTWLSHRDSWDEAALPIDELSSEPDQMRRIAHNHVHRSGHGTLEEGGLYFLHEDWRFVAQTNDGKFDPALVDLYVETGETPERVREIMAHLGEEGYGRDVTTGRGRWQLIDVTQDEDLSSGSGTRRMSLSRGVINKSTMGDAFWKLDPHFGRVGPQLSLTGVSPFKHPVLLTRPGMTFKPIKPGPWGRMLEGLHPSRPEICLNAHHVAIPFTEATGDA